MDEIDIFIPIKSNSTRLPNKNFAKLGSKPLFMYTVSFAMQLPNVRAIHLATDTITSDINLISDDRVKIFKRPKWTTNNEIKNLDFIQFWRDSTNPINRNICLLQATHPFRNKSDFVTGHNKFQNQNRLTVGTFSGDYPIVTEARKINARDYKNVSGQYYFLNIDQILFQKKLLDQDFEIFSLSEPHEELNIDNKIDWVKAEYWLEKNANSLL